MNDPRFEFRIEYEGVLAVHEVWPDADGPDEPSVQDVRDCMESCGSADRVLDQWNLRMDPPRVYLYDRETKETATVWDPFKPVRT